MKSEEESREQEEKMKVLEVFSEKGTIGGFSRFIIEKALIRNVPIISIGAPPSERTMELYKYRITIEVIKDAYCGNDIPLTAMHEYLQSLGVMD